MLITIDKVDIGYTSIISIRNKLEQCRTNMNIEFNNRVDVLTSVIDRL